MKKNIKKIFFIIIFFFCFVIDNFDKYAIYVKCIEDKAEIYKIKSFLKFCSNSNIVIKKFKKRDKPKISIITDIYNREKFLSRFLKNLQYQNFKDIEIIFVDDFSKDNSVNIIKEFQKRDKRIVLIRNKKNRGTFIARNIGVVMSFISFILDLGFFL